MTIHGIFARLMALVRKRQIDAELESEIAAHLELAERDALASGMSPEQARLAARRQFGAIESMKEEHRDRRSFRWLDNVWRDVRYGVAGLGRDPGFTSVVVGVLALGVGANVAMFGLLDAVILKPLPFGNPDRIVRIWEAPRPGVTNATSAPDFLDWRRMSTAFEALGAESPVSMALTGAGDPVRLDGRAVTAEYGACGQPDPSQGTFLRNSNSFLIRQRLALTWVVVTAGVAGRLCSTSGVALRDFAGSTNSSNPNSCGSVFDASGFVQKAISRPGALEVACTHRTGGKAVLPDVAGAASGCFLRKVRWDGSGCTIPQN